MTKIASVHIEIGRKNVSFCCPFIIFGHCNIDNNNDNVNFEDQFCNNSKHRN